MPPPPMSNIPAPGLSPNIPPAASRSRPCANQAFRAQTGAGPTACHAVSRDPGGRLSRRQALSGLLSALGLNAFASAQARETPFDLTSCGDLKPAGDLTYCDLQVGSGDSPQEGDLILVNYTARAVDTGFVYDGFKGYKFYLGQGEVIPGWEQAILGGNGMPPIREGGQRTVIIPPSLAYGKKGEGCLFGRDENCRVPPNSSVEITFQYLYVIG